MSRKTSLVTGGAGFLASHLCDKLISEGHRVIAMDNLITGSMDNIAHLLPLEQFSFYHCDITKFVYVAEDIDYILHFASPASPMDYLRMPIQTLKVGALGTHNLLGLARAKKARILVASTSEIYGDPLEHPQRETYWGNVNTIGPRGVYDEAKRFLESITVAYHRYHKVDTRIVRIFNTYGPRMRANDGRVLPTFIKQAIKGTPMTAFGDGLQTRSFCYVSDLVEGVYKLLLSDYTLPINIGNPEEITIRTLAEEIKALTQTQSDIIFEPLPEDDPKRRRPDITLAQEKLYWHPKVSRKEGLQATIDFFRTLKTLD